MNTKTIHGTLKSYLLGLFLCVLLTLSSYYLVVNQTFSKHLLVATIITLGLIQAVVQLLLFLHLGKETKPRINLLVFSFMVFVLLILVLGSLWIMTNLDYRMM